MAVTRPPIQPIREPVWTPRQREVLDLLVRGHTNGEIAQRLGISLDGAKWHVSEIITRLGVDSRDEAAEYWRHYNGLRMRFTRIASGFFTSGALKWAFGTAFVAGVVVVSAFTIAALRANGDDENEPAGGIQNPGTATPGATAPASATPPPAITPVRTGETIAGVSVSALSFTKPGGLPVPLSVIVERGCNQCDGPTESFDRVSVGKDGQMVVEQLFKPASGYIAASYFDPASRGHYLSVCSRGYCGGVGQVSGDAQSTIYRSLDGGVTWRSLAALDGAVSVVGITDQGPLLNLSTFQNGVTDTKFQVLGTNQVIRPPAGTTPVLSDNRLLGWHKTGTREILNPDGTLMVTLPDIQTKTGRPVQLEAALANGVFLISWIDGSGNDFFGYLGVMKNGQLTTIFKGDSSLNVGSLLTSAVAFGNLAVSPTQVDPSSSDSRLKFHPVMIDLNSGQVTVMEFYGPAFSSNYDNQRNLIRYVEPGPFARVKGAGDCLNVRETPSTTAKSLGCFADKVLFRNMNQVQEAGGITWWKVMTPAGQEGWASAEFLEGSQPAQ